MYHNRSKKVEIFYILLYMGHRKDAKTGQKSAVHICFIRVINKLIKDLLQLKKPSNSIHSTCASLFESFSHDVKYFRLFFPEHPL